MDYQINDVFLDSKNNLYIQYNVYDLKKLKVSNYIVAKYDLEGNLLKEKEFFKEGNIGIGTIKFNKYESNLLIIKRNLNDGTWSVEIEDLF